jgi:hypothetical protein
MVGSQGTRVAQAIAAAPAQKKLAATAAWDATSLRVDVTAPANADVYVAIWQDGTKQRYDATHRNANRGRMPAFAPGFFERTAVQTRAAMLQKAQAVLDRPRSIEGPTVGGAGGSLL